MKGRRRLAAVLALGWLGGACVGAQLNLAQSPGRTTAGPAVHPSPPPSQRNPLCRPIPNTARPGPTAGTLPPDVAQVASQVQAVRQLWFKRAVIPEPLSQSDIQRQLHESLTQQFSGDLVQAEGRTDITIGVLP